MLEAMTAAKRVTDLVGHRADEPERITELIGFRAEQARPVANAREPRGGARVRGGGGAPVEPDLADLCRLGEHLDLHAEVTEAGVAEQALREAADTGFIGCPSIGEE